MAISMKGCGTPNLRPLEHISPTSVFIMENCFLQKCFDVDPCYRDRTFRGPKARLGSVCHEILARVTRGELAGVAKPQRRPKLAEMWKEEVAKEEELLRSSPVESHFGPALRWPGYAIQRARVTRKAQNLSERLHPARSGAGRIWPEKSYQAYQGRLRGRVDLVYSSGGRTEIGDYKTGDIYETRGDEDPPVLKSHYRRQLLLYAAMHHDSTGHWPVAGHIIPLTGDRATVRISPAEAQREVEAALGLLDRFNTEVTRAHSPELLASPSQHACRPCSYKAFCEPFWTCISPDWDWEQSVAIEGVALRIHGSVAREWTIEARVEHGNLAAGVYNIRGNRRARLRSGQQGRIVNLMRDEVRERSTLVLTDYTELWTTSMLQRAYFA